jgi:imidazole glycerol-phosphate synthase subunit HisH
MEVAVVRLGVGNTASVAFALERAGARVVLTDEAVVIADAERVVLPGVAAAGHAMARLRTLGLVETLRGFDRPLLGVCLGQQLLYEESEEGDTPTLGRIAGRVRRLPSTPQMPVPHMGWNRLDLRIDDPLLDGVADGSHVYFAHSFTCPIGPATVASTDYGGAFSAVVRRGQAWGCQFHPERSSAVGARVLRNFLALPC